MLGKAFKLLLEISGVLFAGLLIAIIAIAWRLTNGPIPLDFAQEIIQESLSPPGSSYHMKIGKPTLTWKGWDRVFDITVENVELTDQNSKSIATAPTILVRLSISALMYGLAAPVRITLNHPKIHFSEGSLGADNKKSKTSVALSTFLKRISDPSALDQRMAYFKTLEIRNGTLIGHHLNPSSNLTFQNLNANLSIENNVTHLNAKAIVKYKKHSTTMALSLQHQHELNKLDGSYAFNQLSMQLVNYWLPKFANKISTTSAIDGKIFFELTPLFEFSLLSGTITLPDGSLSIPGIFPSQVFYDSLVMEARYDALADLISVENINLIDKNVSISGNAQLQNISKIANLNLKASVENLPVKKLNLFWPPSLGISARDWVLNNLNDGIVERAEVHISGTVDPNTFSNLKLTDVHGSIDFNGITAHYFKPLIPARLAGGRAIFDNAKFEINISEGHIEDLEISGSNIQFLNLDTNNEKAEINVVARGSVQTALKILQDKALKMAKHANLKALEAQGQFDTHIQFAFPLTNSLTLDQVHFSGLANLKQVVLPDLINGRSFNKGKLTIDLNRDGIKIEGDGLIDGQPAAVIQEESFSGNSNLRRRKRLKTIIDDLSLHQIYLPKAIEIEGSIAIDAQFSENISDQSEISALIDLRDAKLKIKPINWIKPAGAAGRIRFSLELQNDMPRRLTSASLIAGNLGVDLTAEFDGVEWKPRFIQIDRMVLSNSEINGRVDLLNNGHYHGTLYGTHLDTKHFLGEGFHGSETTSPPFTIEGRFDEIQIGDLPPIKQTQVVLRHDGVELNNVRVKGLVNQEPVQITYAVQNNIPRFALEAQQAGQVLAGFDITNSVKEGTLNVLGQIETDSNILDLSIKDFGLVNAPILARVLNAASLVGLVSTLRGRGIQFEKLNAQMRIDDSEIKIIDAFAFGPSLGVSAQGLINRLNQEVNISGMIVPAYGLSRLIDQIPFLGRILTGGEKEGLLAAEYFVRGSLEKPTVTVNPLTAFTPGFLRALVSATKRSKSKR